MLPDDRMTYRGGELPAIPTWLAKDTGLPRDTRALELNTRRARSTGELFARRTPTMVSVERALRDIPLFADLSKKSRREAVTLATPVQAPPTAVLAAEGATPQEFIVILDGEIEVRKGNAVVGQQGRGAHAGETALLARRPRTTTLVARTPVWTLVFGLREFRRLLHVAPPISERLFAEIGRGTLRG